MEPEQIRIQADLRGLIAGDVYCDPLYTQMYASDASVYEIVPLAVVRPRGTQDVVELLRYCVEHELAVYPRGGGSGLAGQSLGRGIVVDFSCYMRRIDAPREHRVRVQCGVVQADLNRELANHGLLFGPDPATRSVSTIGSMLAVDAAGSHFPRYGSAGDQVASLQCVLSSGEVIELSQHEWAKAEANESTVDTLAQQTGLLLQQNSAHILRPPWAEVARGCGYRFEKVLDGDRVDLARLMCGAEGTLGIITEATLKLEPIPSVRGLLLVFFERLEAAGKAAVELIREDLAACDLMDRRLLEIARETEPIYSTIVPRGAEAMLLIELQGEEPAAVRSRLLQVLQRLQRRSKSMMSYRLTTDSEERNLMWRLARRVIPRLYRLKGSQRPLPFIEDISIPPKRLPEFLLEVQNIFKKERTTTTLFAHALHGHVDLRPFLDLADRRDQQRMVRLSEAVYGKVLEMGGCISGEHALGISRAAWAEKQLGGRLELSRRVKQLFDAPGTLNPGKFLSPTPPRVDENVRPVPEFVPQQNGLACSKVPVGNAVEAAEALLGSAERVDEQLLQGELSRLAWDDGKPVVALEGSDSPEPRNRLPVLLDWSVGSSLEMTARSCNGCGRCRTSAAAERMCPVFRVTKGEEASPRAKANLFRGILTGRLAAEHLESRELKAISDLCFNCHQCRMECPANVDVPKLVQEAKAQHVAGHGLPLRERLLNRVDLLAAFGSRFPNLANWSLGDPMMRWMLEKTFGIWQGRKLPRVTRRSFLRWAQREKLNRPNDAAGHKVLFFVDQYVNWHNPLLGRALVEVLRHQNVEVYIPSSQTPSFMAMIAAGDVVRARKLIAPNIKLLSEAVRAGYKIVTTEPSAALCLRHEYRHLIENDDTRLIAENTFEACSYLWSMHTRNELELDLKPVSLSVLYHEPCHVRVLDSRQPGLNLLRLIPGLQVEDAAAGCSGMAGTFGLQRKNWKMSHRVGRGLMNKVRGTVAQVGTTECTACKLQMEQASPKPTFHPVAMLAYAYGCMPQVGAWFTSRNEGRLVS